MNRKWKIFMSAVEAYCAETDRSIDLSFKSRPWLLNMSLEPIIISFPEEERENEVKLQVLQRRLNDARFEWKKSEEPIIQTKQNNLWEALPEDKVLY